MKLRFYGAPLTLAEWKIRMRDRLIRVRPGAIQAVDGRCFFDVQLNETQREVVMAEWRLAWAAKITVAEIASLHDKLQTLSRTGVPFHEDKVVVELGGFSDAVVVRRRGYRDKFEVVGVTSFGARTVRKVAQAIRELNEMR